MNLTKREINIILTLMENEASSTTNDLAEKFHVSVRTIKYDLDNIKEIVKMDLFLILQQL